MDRKEIIDFIRDIFKKTIIYNGEYIGQEEKIEFINILNINGEPKILVNGRCNLDNLGKTWHIKEQKDDTKR